MEFDLFKEELRKQVETELGGDYEVSVREVTKNNGVILTGLMAQKRGNNVFPTLYINDLYREDIEKGETVEIAMKLSRTLREALIPPREIVDDLFDYEKVRDDIYIKLINTDKNRDLLKDIPHRAYLDLTVCYYFSLDNRISAGTGEDCKATVLIRNNFLEKWEIDEGILYEKALENMKRDCPDRLMTMKDILKERFNTLMDDLDPEMYVLTNSANIFGASALLYSPSVKQLSEDLKSDIYILPSSIHELILLPKNENTDASGLLAIVSEVNSTEVMTEEILSDSVYLYERDLDSVSLVLKKDEN
ncbi:MAG: DUF5688 family protein [Lachnospiraceae bacterium]|nr:DUF5688 family protein [Lachnospiraceae bacterium]